MSHKAKLTYAATVAAVVLAGGNTLRAQDASGATLYACYHPSSGTMYRIKTPGAPDACKKKDVEFSWPAVGPVGAQGEQGDVGPEGAQGKTGPQGARGEKGPDGVRGDDGDPGGAGDPGTAGATGKPGDPGADGQQGAAGEKGATGDKGQVGQKGPDGDPGDTGSQGPPGNDGTLRVVRVVESDFAVTHDQLKEIAVPCPQGYTIVSGGIRRLDNELLLPATYPSTTSLPSGHFVDAWKVKVRGFHPGLTSHFNVYAVCVAK